MISEGLEQYGIELLRGERKGVIASTLRGILWLLSFVYRFGVNTRLWLYRKRLWRERNLGCLVISVGNITMGGTGKTPVVEMIARELAQGGRRVAILTRGYKAEKPPLELTPHTHDIITGKKLKYPPLVVSDLDGTKPGIDSRYAGDEPYMLAHNLPGVAVVVGRNRVASGRLVLKEMEVDTLLLDDGLQYLDLRHRLDIVLIDSKAPFAKEYMTPRGFLREPKRSLKRASYIFLTKCDGGSNEEIRQQIRKYNKTAEILEMSHQPKHFTKLNTREVEPLEFLKGKRIAVVSGIARPESFEGGLERLGAEILIRKRFTDHHRYTVSEMRLFLEQILAVDADCLITTEKDAVRFPELVHWPVPVYFLRIEIEILTGQETWEHCVARICKPRPIIPEVRWF
jgi:tetraacyldisaccharide 4'-kinase